MKKFLVILTASIFLSPAITANATKLWDLRVGYIWTYSVTDNVTDSTTSSCIQSSTWESKEEVLGKENFDGKVYLHLKTSNERGHNNVDYSYVRFTEEGEMYIYTDPGEFLLLRLGPVGTSWCTEEDCFEVIKTDVLVTVPYGGPYNAYEIRGCDRFSNYSDPCWYMYIVPDFGFVKDIDHWTDNDPFCHRISELIQIRAVHDNDTDGDVDGNDLADFVNFFDPTADQDKLATFATLFGDIYLPAN